MRKISKNLEQDVFNFFPNTEVWPEGYHNYIIEHFKLHSTDLYKQIIGMDIETEGLNPYDTKVRVISVAISPNEKIAYSLYTLNEADSHTKYGNTISFNYSLDNFRNILTDPDVILVGHNIKYDVNWLAVKYGINVKCMLFDTMFAQYLLDENIESNSLGTLSSIYSDLAGYKDDISRDDLKRESKDRVLIYNCKDADASRRLYNYFVPKLKAGGYDKLMVTSSMVLPVLSKIETRGVYLDKEFAYKTQTKIFHDLVKLRYDMSNCANTLFNPDSPKSLADCLYKNFGFTAKKTTPSGQPSTDSEAIGYLVDQANNERQHLFLDQILKYKKEMKLLTTYYQPIERWTKYDGRVHANYSLGRFSNEEGNGGTVTGRLSCNNPNLQNIPRGKDHRGMFRASDGYIFLDGDFSQLELRVAAFLSQESVMMNAFNNNLDIHTATMANLTGMDYDTLNTELHSGNAKLKNDRVAFKEVNFGIFYGMSAKRLQRTLRVKANIRKSIPECQEYIDAWFGKYTKAKEWLDNAKLFAVCHKYIRMPLGQKRRLPDAEFSWQGGSSLRQATNFPVQSFASWICLIGLKLLDDYFVNNKIDGHIIMQVHDSVTCEISESNLIALNDIKVDVKKIMEVETLNYIRDVFGVDFNVPLSFEIDFKERWS